MEQNMSLIHTTKSELSS